MYNPFIKLRFENNLSTSLSGILRPGDCMFDSLAGAYLRLSNSVLILGIELRLVTPVLVL